MLDDHTVVVSPSLYERLKAEATPGQTPSFLGMRIVVSAAVPDGFILVPEWMAERLRKKDKEL